VTSFDKKLENEKLFIKEALFANPVCFGLSLLALSYNLIPLSC